VTGHGAILAAMLAMAGALWFSNPAGAAMSEPTNASPLPSGAIQIGDDQYMVPLGQDGDGCAQYRMHSQRSAVPDAIFYRAAKGGFTMNRAEANCPPPRSPGSPR
jgi:hypothetical protein